MAAVVNKRQQARNERVLQDLIQSVPGNERCADCAARNPGWASWNLGIFLCMRCAALHRKLGTHISKVKSLSMDTWANEQVEAMKRTGNSASNRTFNPRNIRPNLPIDADEVDMAMEKHIRDKYQTRVLSGGISPPAPGSGAPAVSALSPGSGAGLGLGRSHTGSTSSDDRPPPVPAKNTSAQAAPARFGSNLRANSATYPLQSENHRPLPPSKDNAPPRFQTEDQKLAHLAALGFANERRNATVLRGVGGNLARAVGTLKRLGEGGHASETLGGAGGVARPLPAGPPHAALMARQAEAEAAAQAQAQAQAVSQAQAAAQSPPPPPSAQTTSQTNGHANGAWNPFGAPGEHSQQQQQVQQQPAHAPSQNGAPAYSPPLEAAFGSLALGLPQPQQQNYHQPQPQLFHPLQSPHAPLGAQSTGSSFGSHNPFAAFTPPTSAFTPPLTISPQYTAAGAAGQGPWTPWASGAPPPLQSPPPPSSNPFLRRAASQTFGQQQAPPASAQHSYQGHPGLHLAPQRSASQPLGGAGSPFLAPGLAQGVAAPPQPSHVASYYAGAALVHSPAGGSPLAGPGGAGDSYFQAPAAYASTSNPGSPFGGPGPIPLQQHAQAPWPPGQATWPQVQAQPQAQAPPGQTDPWSAAHQQPQLPLRLDKSSILALYGSAAAPQPGPQRAATDPGLGMPGMADWALPGSGGAPNGMPAAGAAGAAGHAPGKRLGHIREESSGAIAGPPPARAGSPDAFASLAARPRW